jgi:GT2 family glycosyltransferase
MKIMMQDPIILILIVNYRTSDLVAQCLASLVDESCGTRKIRIVIVDNASQDGSAERLSNLAKASAWSDKVTVLPLGRNGGFASGNNAGIASVQAQWPSVDYIVLLNPDTIVRPGAIRALVDFMDAHPLVGIGGSGLENATGASEPSAHTFPSPIGELLAGARLGVLDQLLRRYVVTPIPRDHAHKCDWVSGASMIIRKRVFDDTGPLDEGFFLYFEEVDFCRRAKTSGWDCWFIPESRVVHLEGASTGIRNASRRRPSYWYDSRRRFFLKHHGVLGLVIADILWTFGRITYLIRRSIGIGGKQPTAVDPKWLMMDLLGGDARALLRGNGWHTERPT